MKKIFDNNQTVTIENEAHKKNHFREEKCSAIFKVTLVCQLYFPIKKGAMLQLNYNLRNVKIKQVTLNQYVIKITLKNITSYLSEIYKFYLPIQNVFLF